MHTFPLAINCSFSIDIVADILLYSAGGKNIAKKRFTITLYTFFEVPVIDHNFHIPDLLV